MPRKKSKLDEYVNPDVLPSGSRVLGIDGSNLIYRTVNAAVKEEPLDRDYTYWKHLMLCGKYGNDGLLGFMNTYKPDRVVFAMDSKNYWRKGLYPNYKAKRKDARDKSAIDFEEFFPIMHKFVEDLKVLFSNVMFLEVDRCEADDIIAVMAKYIHASDDFINVSNDGDFYQLMKYKNYRQCHPIKKEFIEVVNPELSLLLKLITGDRNDNIPSIGHRIGVKTAEKIIKGGLDEYLEENPESAEAFNRNRRLIDFDYIPREYVDKIITAYNSYEFTPMRRGAAFSFFVKNKLVGVAEQFQIFSGQLEKLA